MHASERITIFMNSKWRFVVYALFFVFYLVLQISFAKYPVVFSDETDNFYGGLMLSGGYDLYTDFKTHHMPLLYLLYALLYPIFPHTVTMMRFGGFFLITCLYLLVLVRYWRHLGLVPLLLYPLLYIGFLSALATVEFCSITMCSELFEGQGAVILFCEFLLYLNKREISRSSSVVLSLSVVLVFGSVFMGVLSLIVMGASVLVHEVYLWTKEKRETRPSVVRWLVRRNWFTVVAILIPWIIAIAVLAVKGILDEAVYSSYVFNQEVYSKYQESSGNPIALLFVGVATLVTPPTGEMALTPYLVVAYVLFYGGLIGFVVSRVIHREYCAAVTSVLFVGSFCARGMIFTVAALLAQDEYMIFHSTPAWAACALLGLLALRAFLQGKEVVYAALSVIVLVCSLWMYSATYHGIRLHAEDIEGQYATGCVEEVISRYLDDGDKVYNAVLGYDVHLLRDGVPSINGCYLPWFADAYQADSLAQLKAERPKVAFYMPDMVIWNRAFKDYSSDIAQYLQQNYTPVNEPNAPNVYVRNDLVV